MLAKRKEEIREKVNGLRSAFSLTYPLDLLELAKKLNIKVYNSDLEADISGAVISEGGNTSIYLNQNHAETRNLFTFGHELGHFILHHDILDEEGGIISFRDTSKKDYKEYEADYFSAELLMPKDEMLKVAFDECKNTTKELAEHFGVSQQSMNIRIKAINNEVNDA